MTDDVTDAELAARASGAALCESVTEYFAAEHWAREKGVPFAGCIRGRFPDEISDDEAL